MSGSNEFNFGEWKSFFTIVVFLLVFAFTYLFLHELIDGEAYTRLSDEDKTTLTLILSESPPNTIDTLQSKTASTAALNYMVKKLSPKDTTSFVKQYSSLSNNNLIAVLPTIAVKTESYFWLAGSSKYVEVIFWSIFGVLASLLYFSSEAIRYGKFKEEEVSVYFAKVFYAPLIALIIVFSYKTLTSSSNISFDDSSLELLVFSFLLGFFSGRAIELLNKIKEVILPGKDQPAEDDTGKVTLTGKVFFPAEEIDFTLSKGIVKLIASADGKEIQKCDTNEMGIYFFKNVSPGIYNIEAGITLPDNVTCSSSITNINLKKENPVSIENLELKKENNN